MPIKNDILESKIAGFFMSMNIRQKFTIPSAVLLVITFIFFTFYIISDQKKKNFQELNTNAERLTNLIAYTNTENVWNFNQDGLTKNSDSFFQDNDIVSITISDKNETKLIDLKKNIQGNYDFSRSADIIRENNVIGKVDVSFTSHYRDINISQTRNKIGIILLIILILVITGINAIAKIVIAPLKDIFEAVDHLAENDLTTKIQVKSLDEIGKLAKNINHATGNLDNTLSAVKASMKYLHETIAEINRGNQELAQRTSQQAAAIEQIASSMEETASLIDQNSESSTNASDTSKASLNYAEKGNELVNASVVSINEIKDSSRKIGDITSVINEIAFQTNLLALNAAVEAARAGEQGRGFAVVASEVRNLAQRSGSAAKEINKLITESIQKIEKGTAQANESGEAIKEIVASVRNVSNLMMEITASTYEQKSGITQINSAINEMNSMTQQNAALVEETASASVNMSDKAQELADMTEVFKTTDQNSDD